MKLILTHIVRILLGILFIFSGFVKAVDPVGGAIKIGDYLEKFGMHWAIPATLLFSILLSTLEMVVGTSLLFNFYRKYNHKITLLVMLFFTALTLYIAIYNPVSDCGCFGDAIKITNWQTFYKNIVFLLMALWFFKMKSKSNVEESPLSFLKLSFFTTVAIAIAGYSYNNLPIIDFMPYKVGANLIEGKAIPEGAKTDKYASAYYYKKDGVVKEFTEENIPWQDSTWSYVDAKNILIEKGYEPPMKDFFLTLPGIDNFGDYIAQSKKSFVLYVINQTAKAPSLNKIEFDRLFDLCKSKNFDLFIVTSSSENDIVTHFERANNIPQIAYGDNTLLKTLIRSNPGVIFVKNGVILGKYHYNNICKFLDSPPE